MNSSKRITVVACALFVMLGFVAGGISMLFEPDEEEPAEMQTEETSADMGTIPRDEEEKKEKDYVLKIEDGIVVVFNETDLTRPIIVTDIYAGTLRNFDKEQLNSGIKVSGDYELQSILEDFSS